jgi:hypothetical protein
MAAVLLALALPVAGAAAGTSVYMPAGTKVGFEFIDPLDTGTAKVGQKVRLKVVADVVVNRHVVIEKNAPLTGVVTYAQNKGAFGQPSRATLGHLAVIAVDKKPVSIHDIVVVPNEIKSRTGAAAASAAGAILFGPIGLISGGLVQGGHEVIPAGAVVAETTTAAATIVVP